MQDTGHRFQWLEQRMPVRVWEKMRQDHALHRNLVFIVKVTETHGRVLSSRVEDRMEKGHILEMLRQVGKLLSIEVRNRECLNLRRWW